MIAILHTTGMHQLADYFVRFATVNDLVYLGRDGDDHYFELQEAPKGSAVRLQHMARRQSVVRGFSLWKSPADMTPNQQEAWKRLSGRAVSQNTAWGSFVVGGNCHESRGSGREGPNGHCVSG